MRSETWTAIDGTGNWLTQSKTEGAVTANETREFSPANEVLARTVGAAVSNYLYQPGGARVQDPRNLCYYTADGQLREVWHLPEAGDPVLATAYLYDCNGRRCARLSDDDNDGTLETALILVNAGSRVIEEVTAGEVFFTPEDLGNANSSRDTTTELTAGSGTAGRRIREYIFGEMGVDDRIVFRRSSNNDGVIDEAYNYLTDQIGTVFALANGLGGTAEAYDYDAFGAPYRLLPGNDAMLFTEDDVRLAPSPGVALSLLGNPYFFQSRRYESSSGYYDFRARFYDALLGTWLTRDPAGFVNGSNLYQFVGSLPWTLDPFGLCGRERETWEHFRDGAAEDVLPKTRRRRPHVQLVQMPTGSDCLLQLSSCYFEEASSTLRMAAPSGVGPSRSDSSILEFNLTVRQCSLALYS